MHGKLIGGGVALCLATTWRVGSHGASFNFGNLPRGMNPLFMLSRSLPLIVGHDLAVTMYLEDPILSSHCALKAGVL